MGTILLPIEDTLVRRSAVLISRDNGLSWFQSHFIEAEDGEDCEDYDDVRLVAISNSPYSIYRQKAILTSFAKMYGITKTKIVENLKRRELYE